MIVHILDARAIWIKEFAFALSKYVRVIPWLPEISFLGTFKPPRGAQVHPNPLLLLPALNVQRGFSRPLIQHLTAMPRRLIGQMLRYSGHSELSVLICTAPAWAPIAERWPGAVIYYVTDAFASPGYTNNPRLIRSLDKRMCLRADLVCPNSRRIAGYLLGLGNCPPSRVCVIPNATRSTNIYAEPPVIPDDLPSDVPPLPRPIAGVIGNLAGNMNWVLLKEVIEFTPWLSWLFIGPTDMPIQDKIQNAARLDVMRFPRRVYFTGAKPYGRLYHYARSFDVAVLPYRGVEPTYSGSSTRFYEHLAACRPMLATRGFEELLHKEPLLKLADSSHEMIRQLEALRSRGFKDGLESVRWQQSKTETWENRASTMLQSLERRLHGDASTEPTTACLKTQSVRLTAPA